ncbi:hypothetical protein C9374_002038 [Naegleria lovaniensis]|uniref:Cryptochrome DASH n=1 Tax=Naegleria lovaniensis TaxID=51637 RepID=A0AA88GVC6_NAELO|nr:uncharacterized protein C9374_002038 [Naegleria lovaniensis]KAG2387003.1 hypothetical protein C9374_002038 [Naegleria lovaniensis]
MLQSLSSAKAGSHRTKVIGLWFRNDLRIHDNEALFKAVELAKSEQKKILCLYVFDQSLTTQKAPYTLSQLEESCGPRRCKFLVESVQNLFANLQGKMMLSILPFQTNVHLDDEKSRTHTYSYENVRHFTTELVQRFNMTDLFMNREFCTFEKEVEKEIENACKDLKVKLNWTWSNCLVHGQDLPYEHLPQDIPKTFSAFRKKIEKKIEENKDVIRKVFGMEDGFRDFLLSSEEIETNLKDNSHLNLIHRDEFHNVDSFMKARLFPQMSQQQFLSEIKQDERSVLKFEGGEDSALDRCKSYLDKHLKNYSSTRNDNLGDYSTKLSPWLALGCISARYIYHEIKKKTSKNDEKTSGSVLINELLWRDYFKMLAWKMGRSFFFKKALQPSKQLEYEWKIPKDGYKNVKFQAWCQGNTGYPFVDACMKELLHTGFMNNRGRMVVASFLVKDMKIDWRLGAEYFERNLIDFDPASNVGNWCWVAGVGCDFRPRYFNPIKQGMDHDKEGKYVKQWIPELSEVSQDSIHLPYLLLRENEKRLLKLPNHYSSKDNLACSVELPSALKRKFEKGENSANKKRK